MALNFIECNMLMNRGGFQSFSYRGEAAGRRRKKVRKPHRAAKPGNTQATIFH